MADAHSVGNARRLLGRSMTPHDQTLGYRMGRGVRWMVTRCWPMSLSLIAAVIVAVGSDLPFFAAWLVIAASVLVLVAVVRAHRDHALERQFGLAQVGHVFRDWQTRWSGIAMACGLSTVDASGALVVPALGRPTPHSLGVELPVVLLLGQSEEDYQARCAPLAHGLGVRQVRVESAGPGRVLLVAVVRDPLVEVVHLPTLAVARAKDPVFIGRAEGGGDVWLDLVEPAAHLCVQGQTRSGKSLALNSMLLQLAGRQDLIIAGADPTGLLLAPFDDSRHARWQSSGLSDMEAHAINLEGLVVEMDRRIAQLRARRIDKVDSFSISEPLIFCVLEEYPGLLSAARSSDAVAGRRSGARVVDRIQAAVARLVAESAKAGIRVCMIVQRADANTIGGDVRAQLGTRVSFRVDDSTSVRMLHEGVDAQLADAQVNASPGVALMQSPSLGTFATVRLRTPYIEGYRAYFDGVVEGCKVVESIIRDGERPAGIEAEL